jgi:hypothetical protein
MLLAAPRLAKIPSSFWQLLMQYILFLVPQWRQQVSSTHPIIWRWWWSDSQMQAGAVVHCVFSSKL